MNIMNQKKKKEENSNPLEEIRGTVRQQKSFQALLFCNRMNTNMKITNF